MKLFAPFEGQRVWNRSVDRELDIYEITTIFEVRVPPRHSYPLARCYVRRPGRGAGPTIWVGPFNSPFAGAP